MPSSASRPSRRATTFAVARSAISPWPVAAAAPQAPSRTRSRRTRSMSSRTFSATPSVSSSVACAVERQQRARPGDRLPHAGQLVELALAQPRDRGAHARRDLLGHAGQPRADDLGLALGRRVVDPVVQAAALERVVQLARAVGGQHDQRPVRGGDRPQLRDRDREVGQELEQERLELVVGAVDLVDQQHRRAAVVLERLQQRPAQQELRPEQLARRRARLGRPDRQQLALVVPVVDRVVEVDALVALEPDQLGAGARPPARAPPRSCPRPPRPRAAAAARARRRGRRPWPGPGRRGIPRRPGPAIRPAELRKLTTSL